MIINNATYKGYSLSNSTYNIVLQWESKAVNLRTDIFNKQNFHGANSSYTLAEWRLFTFTWVIYGATYQARQTWIDYINWLIKPEWIPTSTNTWFYELTWEDWNANKFKTNAKVYKMCEFTHKVNEPVIEFTFSLYSDLAWYYWYTDQVVTGTDTWNFVWVELSTLFTFELSTLSNTIQVSNSWNFVAPCKIRLVWSLENPVVYNNTTWTAYRLDWITTTDLVIDNRWETLVVTDEWLNIAKYRDTGSSSIFLNPWINEIFAFWDNASPSVTATIEYNHTYIWS